MMRPNGQGNNVSGDIRQRRFEELPSPDPSYVQALADDHPAILQRLPLFENSIVNANDSPRLFVSGENNRKIGRVITKGDWKGLPIYVLTLAERATCPTACHMYKSCYGNAMPFARRHAAGPELEAKIPKELVALSLKHPRGFVIRLHVLGDFYSAAYAHLWSDMLATYDALHIYGYTALGESSEPEDAATLDVIEAMNANCPERCFIRMSSSESIPGGAVVIDRLPESANVAEGLVCPAERDATACCATCGMCWEEKVRDKTIVFLKHGMGSQKTERLANAASRVDATGMRKVEPLRNIARLASRPQNEPPTLMWVRASELCIDETYQRNLSRKSISLISRIVQNWNWTHFKPPIVVKDETNNNLYVLDGQHTAIAAASHPSIDKIPIMVVDAEQVSDRAKAFIGHNRDRISVTPTQLHHSAIVANDTEAIEIDAVCKAAGVKILRQAPPKGVFGAGETVALSSIRSLIRARGYEKAKTVLSCLVQAQRAPVRADEMKAIALVLASGNPDATPVSIIAVLKSLPYDAAIKEARDIAASAALPIAEALAAVFAKRVAAKIPEAAE